MFQIYAVTLLGVCLGQMTPGPNLFAVAGAAMGQGWRASLWMTLGVATAIFFWVTLATFGLASLLALYPDLLAVMKIIGGGYFCFLCVKSVRAAMRNTDVAFQAGPERWSPATAWRKGLLVNLSNPKSALMWGAITTFMFGSGLSDAQVLGFAPVAFVSALVIYGSYGFLFARPAMRRLYGRFKSVFEVLFGTVFGLAGAALVISGVRDIAR